MQLFCVVIIALTIEITNGFSSVDKAARPICYDNPRAKLSGNRICHSSYAAAISSIMLCVVWMIFDAIIPCVDKMVRVINLYH